MTNNPKTLMRTLAAAALFTLSGNAAALLPFETTGNLYVSMWSADEVAVFSPDGTTLERFSADGLDGPRGIAFNPANGNIWIAGEFSDAIYIFDHNHQFLRTLEHEDFNEPVGVTFTTTDGTPAEDESVYISNSNGNEIMVFNQSGELQRRFTAPSFNDPNCSAFMQDGSLFVSNRLGGTTGTSGAVTKFDANDEFLFDFTTTGIASLMAVARDPNIMPAGFDDTIWATSGAGDSGIYEFDQSGNLLTSLLPADIGDGRNVVPQGIAFDSSGDFYVVSFLNEVLKFDTNGALIMRFPTGAGTARSTAFQGCSSVVDGQCVPFGVDADSFIAANDQTSSQTGGQTSGESNNDTDGTSTDASSIDNATGDVTTGTTDGANNLTGDSAETSSSSSSSSGGGAGFGLLLSLLLVLPIRRLYHQVSNG